MSSQLINLYNASTNRIVDALKITISGDSELPLTDVLVISRILFAIVMIGFIGYFFDRMKQSMSAESKAATNSRGER
jgi:flagellar biogenesis protein FliO